MQCPECSNEVQSGELYCGVCGTEIRLTFEDLQDKISAEIKGEKETDTEKQMRNLLMWFAFFMLTAWTLDCETSRGLVGVDDTATDDAYRIPVYSTRNELVGKRIYEDDSIDTVQKIIEQEQKNILDRSSGGVGSGKGS